MLEKIFTTKGRLNRLAYLKYVIGFSVASFILNFIVGIIAALLTGSAESTLMYILSVIVTLPLSVGAIMAAIRRLHDLNRSGWFMLLTLIPVVNFIFGIYIVFFRGTKGYNKYGADPLGY